MNKKVIILGGGTFSPVRAHMALAAPAFGTTAKQIKAICDERFENMDVELVLTKMADSNSSIVTNDDVDHLVQAIINDNTTKVVFFNMALCDFDGKIGEVKSGKYAKRLESAAGDVKMTLTPSEKIIGNIRQERKDIFLVGFKTTCGATEQEQFSKGLNLMKNSSCNIVLANDIKTRNNFIITPEEGVYGRNMSRDNCLKEMADIAWHRTHLSFTRSNVVAGSPVPWSDERVFSSLRTVVDFCVSEGAYKEFKGATTGHFAAKLGGNKFLTSIRKTNFNDLDKNGMVLVETEGDDNVTAYGSKPSVGGQSQRIIFGIHDDTDCIVHFHCPLREDSIANIPVVSQREYECGSHQCGQNTADGLSKFGNLYCVMLDNHGPNIVFNHSIDPQEVINFIEDNFDLGKSTSGFEKVYLGFDKKEPELN
jgi:hypothetical protein